MTRWPNLYELLTGKPALTDVQRRVAEAKARAEAAYQRRDDRDFGRAMMDLRSAQHERLRTGQ